jgi:hypothetical protein
VNWIVSLIQNGDPCSNEVVVTSFFQTVHDILTCPWISPTLVSAHYTCPYCMLFLQKKLNCLNFNIFFQKFLEVLTKFPVKYLLYPVTSLSSYCNHTKPVFLLTDILFSQLSSFKESYVDERCVFIACTVHVVNKPNTIQ